MSEFLECPKNETIELCPICNSPKKPDNEWPQAGTHVFTIPYECGTEIDYPIGHEGASYGVTCNGNVKRFVMPKITKEIREKFKYKSFYKPNQRLKNTIHPDVEVEDY